MNAKVMSAAKVGPKCPRCDGTEIDTNPSGGESVCVQCGAVIDDANIVSSVEFSESR